METDKKNIYEELVDTINNEGGYFKFAHNKDTLRVKLEGRNVEVRAIYVSDDDSSPLKVIDSNFHSWDLWDYFSRDCILMLLNQCRAKIYKNL